VSVCLSFEVFIITALLFLDVDELLLFRHGDSTVINKKIKFAGYNLFCRYLTSRYDAVVDQIPLMAVHRGGKIDAVDSMLWTPPPLRPAAVGWNPEWGKVWQWWGVPLYTF
jgi:hypothetical protein